MILLGEVDSFSLGIFSAQKRPYWVVLVLIGIGGEYVALYHNEIFLSIPYVQLAAQMQHMRGLRRVWQGNTVITNMYV